MNDMDYRIILGELVEIKKRLDSIEQASTLRANSEQSVVGQPNVGDSENPALARPATLTKVRSIVQRLCNTEKPRECLSQYGIVCKEIGIAILQEIEDLDQGPIAKSSQGDELYEAALEYFRSRIRQQ